MHAISHSEATLLPSCHITSLTATKSSRASRKQSLGQYSCIQRRGRCEHLLIQGAVRHFSSSKLAQASSAESSERQWTRLRGAQVRLVRRHHWCATTRNCNLQNHATITPAHTKNPRQTLHNTPSVMMRGTSQPLESHYKMRETSTPSSRRRAPPPSCRPCARGLPCGPCRA